MKKGDGILNLAAMVLTAVAVFLLGRFGFSLFGFTFEQPWQFVLFMALFLTLDTVCGELGEICWASSWWQEAGWTGSGR